MRNHLRISMSAVVGATALAVAGLTAAPAASALTTTGTTGSGCAPTDATVPSGASYAGAGDIDGDGENDRVWVSGTRKGFVTASGAVFSRRIANAGGPEVGIRALHLKDDVVALIEQGRVTYVSALVNCNLHKTFAADGDQFQVDRGLTTPYQDLGCIADDDYSDLNLLTLRHDGNAAKPWVAKQNVVNVSADGRSADLGESSVHHYTRRSYAMAALEAESSDQTCSTGIASQV